MQTLTHAHKRGQISRHGHIEMHGYKTDMNTHSGTEKYTWTQHSWINGHRQTQSHTETWMRTYRHKWTDGHTQTYTYVRGQRDTQSMDTPTHTPGHRR